MALRSFEARCCGKVGLRARGGADACARMACGGGEPRIERMDGMIVRERIR